MNNTGFVDSNSLPVIVKKETIHKGKWLATNLLHYIDAKGNTRQWESVGRTTKLDNDALDGVVIIPVLKRTLHHDSFVMVKQFRPPVGCYTLEFPAGLIDKKDDGPESAALRELLEETGYRGKIKGTFENLISAIDPGAMESTMTFVCVEINGDSEENAIHNQQLDDGEIVDVVLFPVRDFCTKGLNEWCKACENKVVINSWVYAYALGFQMAGIRNEKKKVSTSFDDQWNTGVVW